MDPSLMDTLKEPRVLRVRGGRPLSGVVRVQGAKNAALPLLAASLMIPEPVTLEGIPAVRDVEVMVDLLGFLGAEVVWDREARTITVDAGNLRRFDAPYTAVRKMRASVYVLAPLLNRFGQARVAYPGGCAFGPRPIDFHLRGLETLGTTFTVERGEIHGRVRGRLKGGHFAFDRKSVGATIQLVMAAVMAEGTTVLENVAREPEVTTTLDFLVAAGAQVEGVGTDRLVIHGVGSLHSPGRWTIIPDRIEAGTWLMAVAVTGGEVLVKGIGEALLPTVMEKLREAGLEVEEREEGIRLASPGPGALRPLRVVTEPFPGFPTDLQPQMTTLLSLVPGTSRVRDTIYPTRFHHAEELRRLGARIEVEEGMAWIEGVERLSGAPVEGRDLRAAAALVLAGLAAEGETWVAGYEHLIRGYEDFTAKLRTLGGEVDVVVEG